MLSLCPACLPWGALKKRWHREHSLPEHELVRTSAGYGTEASLASGGLMQSKSSTLPYRQPGLSHAPMCQTMRSFRIQNNTKIWRGNKKKEKEGEMLPGDDQMA